MEQIEFLDKNLFTDLQNLNEGSDKATAPSFSESDFALVLERAEYFGIAVYTIETKLNGVSQEIVSHEKFKKKATDSRWYNGAFLGFKAKQPNLTYSATYKVSNKMLTRENVEFKKDEDVPVEPKKFTVKRLK